MSDEIGMFEIQPEIAGMFKIVLRNSASVPLYCRTLEGAQVWVDTLNEIIGNQPIHNSKAEVEQQAGRLVRSFNEEVTTFELGLLEKALADNDFNHSKAAESLGMNRTTLVAKLKKMGLQK
jgi:DNA-binding NtrC family response regulator